MTDFIMYAKAICISCAALFGICWCVIGFEESMYAVIVTMITLLVAAAIISASVTLIFIFFDWKNRNEDSDPA